MLCNRMLLTAYIDLATHPGGVTREAAVPVGKEVEGGLGKCLREAVLELASYPGGGY